MHTSKVFRSSKRDDLSGKKGVSNTEILSKKSIKIISILEDILEFKLESIFLQQCYWCSLFQP